MENTKDREIVLSREFDAPRELVWKAYTQQEHVEKWWGPNGFTTTTSEMSVRKGGSWKFVMHGPDGTDYPNLIEYERVEAPHLLVFSHGDDGKNEIQFHVTITFEEVNGKTKLTMRSVFPTAEARERVVKEYGAIEGGIQHLAKLAEYLKGM